VPTRRRTRTSSFGSGGRTSHDSSAFYSGRLYDDRRPEQPIEVADQQVPPDRLDRVYLKSSEQMSELPDHSVHLMVTSPPYNARKEYDEDLSLEEYRALLKRVFSETFRVLVTGGRACLNVANLGRKPYIPLHVYLIQDMLAIGYQMRGEIIWDKAASAAGSTAWGSWRSAANPVLRDVHEYILIFSKGSFSRKPDGRESTIEREEFLEWTKSVWRIPAASARQVGHPAPFPVELPERLIKLYTYRGEVVLDPFVGSGTTCVAALQTDRHFVGYETEPEYVRLAEERIQAARLDQPRRGPNAVNPSATELS